MADDNIASFCSVTGSTPDIAQSFLSASNNNLEVAIQSFFAAGEDGGEMDDDEAPTGPSFGDTSQAASVLPVPNGGGNSLGGGAAEALPQGWGSNTSRGGTGARLGRVGQWGGSGSGSSTPNRSTGSGPRVATLGSLASAAAGPSSQAGHGHGDDDPPELYAGGERSGINVENPDRPAGGPSVVRDILKQAAEAGASRGDKPEKKTKTGWFGGAGNTVGSEDTPSTTVGDLDPEAEEEEAVTRDLTFWRDGFSIEDGPLMRYDDPISRQILQRIQSGEAPPALLNVRLNQPVEIRVRQNMGEDYRPPPPKPRGPFEGSGNRLGAPTPSMAEPAAAAPPTSSTSTGNAAGGDVIFQVDTNAPTTSVQLRLADGSKLVAKLNLTHTVGDLRSFINHSQVGGASRSYALQTTFPRKDLDDDSQTVQAAGLQNAVVVQRWT